MRAIFADAERCQREADREAENRKHGDYNPVFYWPSANKSDVQFYRGKKPPKFWPKHMLMCSLRDAYSHDDGWVSNLSETIASGDNRNSVEEPWLAFLIAAEKERQFLSDKEAAILDWMVDPQDRTLTQVAADNDMSKGNASKIKDRLIGQLKKRLKS